MNSQSANLFLHNLHVKLICSIIEVISLKLSYEQQGLMIEIEINSINISTYTCLQDSLVIGLDEELTNELVDRANSEAKVPQVLSINF